MVDTIDNVSLDYYLGIALGELNMRVVEFWEMRLKDFFLKLHYYNRYRHHEAESRANLVRMQTIALINIQLSKKDKITDPRKFWTFPWEEYEKENVCRASEQDIDNAMKLGKLL